MPKTIEELTIKELLEDLTLYTKRANCQSPPFCDDTFKIIYGYIRELQNRLIK